MNILNRVRIQHYVNVILSMVGIAGSFYIIGWVQHQNHMLVGTVSFVAFLIAIVLSTINFNAVKNKIEKQE